MGLETVTLLPFCCSFHIVRPICSDRIFPAQSPCSARALQIRQQYLQSWLTSVEVALSLLPVLSSQLVKVTAAGEMGFGWAVKLISCRYLASYCTSLRVSYESCFLEKSHGLYSVYQNSCLPLRPLFLVAPVTHWACRCCWMLLNCPQCQPAHSHISDGKNEPFMFFPRSGKCFLTPVTY